MDDKQIRLEDCRADVLQALYARRTGAHEAGTIRTVFLRNRDYTLQEVEEALNDLESFHDVENAYEDAHSAVKVWKITGAGRTKIERRAAK